MKVKVVEVGEGENKVSHTHAKMVNTIPKDLMLITSWSLDNMNSTCKTMGIVNDGLKTHLSNGYFVSHLRNIEDTRNVNVMKIESVLSMTYDIKVRPLLKIDTLLLHSIYIRTQVPNKINYYIVSIWM